MITPLSSTMPFSGSVVGHGLESCPFDVETPFLGPSCNITLSYREKEAFEFAKDAKVPTGTLTLEKILPEYIRAVENMHVMVDWQKSVFAEQPAPREGGRITSRDIFGMPGSATGPEAVRRLKEKDDKQKAKETAAASKKEMNNNKKAKETAERVTLGSDLLKKIEQFGAATIITMSTTQLHALLVNANPLGSMSKPTKKVGIERALQLDTVTDAIMRHDATRTHPHPPHPPPHPPPIAFNYNNISFLQTSSPAAGYISDLTPFAAPGPDPSDVASTPSFV
jgi:hypothetical protein